MIKNKHDDRREVMLKFIMSNESFTLSQIFRSLASELNINSLQIMCAYLRYFENQGILQSAQKGNKTHRIYAKIDNFNKE